MKQKMELMAVVCAAVMMGCSSGDDGQRVAYEQESVTLTFCPYEKIGRASCRERV